MININTMKTAEKIDSIARRAVEDIKEEIGALWSEIYSIYNNYDSNEDETEEEMAERYGDLSCCVYYDQAFAYFMDHKFSVDAILIAGGCSFMDAVNTAAYEEGYAEGVELFREMTQEIESIKEEIEELKEQIAQIEEGRQMLGAAYKETGIQLQKLAEMFAEYFEGMPQASAMAEALDKLNRQQQIESLPNLIKKAEELAASLGDISKINNIFKILQKIQKVTTDPAIEKIRQAVDEYDQEVIGDVLECYA